MLSNDVLYLKLFSLTLGSFLKRKAIIRDDIKIGSAYFPDVVLKHHWIIYSNKKETSDFHGTVSFDRVKISQQNKTKMFTNARHTKIDNHLILSSYLRG